MNAKFSLWVFAALGIGLTGCSTELYSTRREPIKTACDVKLPPKNGSSENVCINPPIFGQATANNPTLLIVIGGNSERSAGWDNSLLKHLTASDYPLLSSLTSAKSGSIGPITARYYSWTGDPISDTDKIPRPDYYFGRDARKILEDLEDPKSSKDPACPPPKKVDLHSFKTVIVVGWSNGGDTAYKLARRISDERRPVDVLITLDPVSRITSLHWLPFSNHVQRPWDDGGKQGLWLHAYTGSTGMDRVQHFGNIVAAIGGAWNAQPNADLSLAIRGNHGDTWAMWKLLIDSDVFAEWDP